MPASVDRPVVRGRPTNAPCEFLVSVDLYVSNAVGSALPKPVASTQRRKVDKRESSSALADDSKLREKTSWLNLTKGLGGVGHWRRATCRLTEEGERCLLNIYVDDSILYQTVYIHLLHQTDIRMADDSLFFRKECLAIYCVDSQRWTSLNSAEPIYLQFPNTDASSTWVALLKSYAIPEIYGRWLFPSDGGSYRMWRQLELKIIQGRNLGVSKPSDAATSAYESNADVDVMDIDVSCEVHLNDVLCGRTTVKRGLGSPDWHEMFSFPDLPPFQNLQVTVWREKRLLKPGIIGSIRVPLSNFRRGEDIEGWFPVIQRAGPSDLQVGELRLKIRVEEEIVLPYVAYSGLLTTFQSRNFLDWMNEFENQLDLRTISTQMMSLAIANNVLIGHIQEYALREVVSSASSHQTVFRGNSILTKVMELCMSWYGKTFLEASIGTVLRRLCAERITIEVDPARSGKSPKDVSRNVEQLVYWCQEFWNQIYSARAQCPQEMRRLFETIRKLVERRYGAEDIATGQGRELPWQSVSAFCFLRFIVPAILNPHLFGLCPGLPSPPVQRSLKLIAKVIQSLANLNTNVQREAYMSGVKDFLEESLPAMHDYILVVSTPTGDNIALGTIPNRHDRLNVVNSLRQRRPSMPVLVGESIPILPYLLDVPRLLATVTSSVIRHSRNFRSKGREPDDGPLNTLCSKCFEVEEQALVRVSQLATRLGNGVQRPSTSERFTQISTTMNSSGNKPPSSPTSFGSNSKAKQRKTARPSTAPSPSDSKPPLNSSSNSRRFFIRQQSPEEQMPGDLGQRRTQLLHIKSPSTDSVSSHGIKDLTTIRSTLRTETVDAIEDTSKRKKGILRGILRR